MGYHLESLFEKNKQIGIISRLVERHDGVRRQVVIPAEAGIQKNKKNILQ